MNNRRSQATDHQEENRKDHLFKMEECCERALNQIREREYVEGIQEKGYKEIRAYGIALCGKDCFIKQYSFQNSHENGVFVCLKGLQSIEDMEYKIGKRMENNIKKIRILILTSKY